MIKEFKGHTSAIMAVAFSSDGKQLLTGGADKSARLWDVEKGTPRFKRFPEMCGSPIESSVAIRKDGKSSAAHRLRPTAWCTFTTSAAAPKETRFFGRRHLSGVGRVGLSPRWIEDGDLRRRQDG